MVLRHRSSRQRLGHLQPAKPAPPADDVLALIDSFDFLTAEDKLAIVHDNPLRMFPLIAKSRALARAAV